VRTPNSRFIEFPSSTESLAQGLRLTKSLGYRSDYTGNPPAGLHGFVKLLHGMRRAAILDGDARGGEFALL
jgi:hypothetical protein